jgi:cytochrome P450
VVIRPKKGEKIMPMLAAANLDPQANGNPDKLNLARRLHRHMPSVGRIQNTI